MARRRKNANGEGSITYVKGRKSPWWARLPAEYDINGKEYRPTVGFYKTRKEAENALKGYLSVDDIKTFKEIYESYKETNEFKNLSKKTRNRYDDAFLSYKPLWDKDIILIKTQELQACINRKEQEGYYVTIKGKKVHKDYSKSSLERLKHVASKIYTHAMKYELVDKDRAYYLEVGGVVNVKEKNIFYAKDIENLFSSIKKNPDCRHILMMIFTGMRTSEYLNLKVDNFDLQNDLIKNFGIKTEAGRMRIMFIHESIKKIAEQLVNESTTGYFVENIHISSQNPTPTHPSDQTFRKRIFNKALETINLSSDDYTPINCRYTFATIAHMSGITDEALMKLMGHTSINITSKSYIQDIDLYIKSELNKYNISKARIL